MRSEDLKYFLAVASTGRLGDASDLAGISQPGLTKAVARLEVELGCSLFRRTGRGMQLTEAGMAFELRAQRMVTELGSALSEARALHPLQGVLRMGVSPSIEPLLTPACVRLMKQRPLLRMEFMVLITDYLAIAVGSGRLDLAVAAKFRDMPDELSFISIGSDERRIAVSADHPLARAGAPITLKDLVNEHWALPRRESAVRRYVDDAFAEKSLPGPNVRLENEFSLSAYSIIAGCGLLTVCTPYILNMLPKRSLVPLDVTDFQWRRDIGVLTRRDAPASSLAQDFIEILVGESHHTASTWGSGAQPKTPDHIAKP